MQNPQSMVALYHDPGLIYPDSPPFAPDRRYPELEKVFGGKFALSRSNPVYAAVRETFRLLGLDVEHCGTVDWNPLGELIMPGQTVLIKPNMVMHEIGAQVGSFMMHTHGAIIRAVADYVMLALRGAGRLIVADAPVQCADFTRIAKEAGLRELESLYRGQDTLFSVMDLRKEWARLDDASGMILERIPLPGDPLGYCKVSLGERSSLEAITTPSTRFSVTGYDDAVTRENHRCGEHNYLVSATVLAADVVLNLAKLKTHMKTGLTASLKNLVGINGSKDFLPHHRVGAVSEGGDEFPRRTFMNTLFRTVRDTLQSRAPLPVWRVVRWAGLRARQWYVANFETQAEDNVKASMVYGGSWYGNDTTWRMVYDLNKIILFADREGVLCSTPQRRVFSMVDGIVAGEGEGPLKPQKIGCGLLLAGTDPFAVDTVAAEMMGFDPGKIPMLTKPAREEMYRFASDGPICVVSNRAELCSPHGGHRNLFRFHPPSGWVGHIESL